MSEVVEDLRRERADALLELQEFDHAMTMMLRNILELQAAFHELCIDMAALAEAEGGLERAALQALAEKARRLSSNAEQIGAAFEQFHSAMSAWGARAPD